MKRYRKERNELRKQMETLKHLPQQILELQEKLSALEKKVDHLTQSVNVPEPTKSLVEEEKINEDVSQNQVNLEEQVYKSNERPIETHIVAEAYLIEQYYNNPHFLSQYAYKVTPTKKTLEDIYLNRASEVIFQLSNQSDYWIVELESGGYCLLPDLALKINTNIKTVKTIFDLQNYQDNLSKTFQVIKSARVYDINQREWKLSEKGILQF
jgi:hypothetical protein